MPASGKPSKPSKAAKERTDRLANVAGSASPPFSPELADSDVDHPMKGTELDATPRGEASSAPDAPRPVRMTVVLGPVEYDRLQAFTHDAQQGTGRRGVAASEVTRLALARVLGDETLRAELRETIKREGGNRRREGGKRTRA